MSAGHHWRRRFHISTVIFFGLLMAAPFYWMIINSFKSSREVVAYPPTWWPTEWHFENVFAALAFRLRAERRGHPHAARPRKG